MRTVIVYSSILGTTKKYAMWLREALEADLSRANAGRVSALNYDLIIVCSPTYMGQIRLLGYLKKRWKCPAGEVGYSHRSGDGTAGKPGQQEKL